ncbi:hypothetical protein KJ870_07140 [bacterium]|nr:hypothetical protein [bacterium]MBU1434694.1 hypothetical protein [bacterium]MBU1502682.1 hypothetical protein [bacterium]
MAFDGITEKKMKNGKTAIMVRFKYDGKIYPVKNFTKLYGIEKPNEAKKKLDQIKVGISQGIKPFVITPFTLTDVWKKRLETKRTNGKWSAETCRNYGYFFNKHIEPLIGNFKLSKITYDDLKEVVDKMPTIQGGSKNRVQKLIYPIFDDAIKNGILNHNPCKYLEVFKSGNDTNLKHRCKNSNLVIARELYKAIPKYKVHQKSQHQEIINYLFLVLFSAHRIGELLRLTKEMVIIEEELIIAPETITKTKQKYRFPIPPICLDYIKNVKSGLLFPTLQRPSIYNIFQRLLKITDLKFYDGETISPHDIRRVMMNVMVVQCGIDGILADSCLSHQQKGSTKHYVGFEDIHIREAYEKYWDKIVLTDKEYDEKYNKVVKEFTPIVSTISNDEKLIKFHEMFKDGLLTKEEFIEKKKALLQL